MTLRGEVLKRSWEAAGWLEAEDSGGTEHVKREDLRGARGERIRTAHREEQNGPRSRAHRAGGRAPIVAVKPGNAGGAKGCRKVETWKSRSMRKNRRYCLVAKTTGERPELMRAGRTAGRHHTDADGASQAACGRRHALDRQSSFEVT